ncbi:MAG: YdcF family protein [Bacteroidota bacterium]
MGARTTGGIVRGLALFLGAFTLLNIIGDLVTGFDGNTWWIDLHPIPWRIGEMLLGLLSGVLIAYALRPRMRPWRRWLTIGVAGITGVVTLGNAIGFHILLARGDLPSAFPIPFSLFMTAMIGTIVAAIIGRIADTAAMQALPIAATVFVSLIVFPLMQMLCFGRTDYRRPADAIVVLGARAYANGAPSLPLADRVRTACELYQQHLAPVLIFSGGDGDGAISEPESMRRMAIRLGVPESAIILDPKGVNTQATIDNTIPILRRIGARRVMAVSHFYHLPRIKMAYQQEGREVLTVPARESRTLLAIPVYIGREVLGLWGYYLRPFWRAGDASAPEA